MLDLINRYAHGFAVIPVVLACRKGGFFDMLSRESPLLLWELALRLGANDGHLQVALRMFQSLNWISGDGRKGYSLTSEAEMQKEIPGDAVELYELPIDSYLSGSHPDKALLKPWIDRLREGWGVASQLIADFLDGILVIRVLVSAQKADLMEISGDERRLSFPKVSPLVREELRELFLARGWGNPEEGVLRLTDAGRYLVERIMITGTIASYAPMFRRVGDLIFGNPDAVMARDNAGLETHIDRTLNVRASGFQHDKYFAAMEDIILSIFDGLPYKEQPKYVADMGCGDGSLLKRIYDVIRFQSARGKVLDQYPVVMIGADYNEEALRAAAGILKDIPSLLVKGDVADPGRFVDDLKRLGVTEPERILHVRSFLDHDRPYLPPKDPSGIEARSAVTYNGVYVDRKGRSIPAPEMAQSLKEHLERWASAVGGHGLIITEVHCLEPATVHEYLDRSENLHFDAYHAFSNQYLVEAGVFLMAAAEAGLFPRVGFSSRFPRTFPFARISINWFEKRPYTVRHPVLNDLPRLIALEERCLPEHLRASPEEIKRRIENYPDGHCVLELDGCIAGAVYSQRIRGRDMFLSPDSADNRWLHEKRGPVIQLLGVSVLPEAQDKGLGDQLLEFMLQWSALKSGVTSVVGVTRCGRFAESQPMSMEEYMQSRDELGLLRDPILRFHEQHGAEIVGSIADYRPRDTDNLGKGVLIEYDIHNRRTMRDRASAPEAQGGRAQPVQREQDVRAVVEKCIRSLMGRRGKRGIPVFSPEHTLKEMGLDSLDLMELKSLLTGHFEVELDSSFFFKYFTSEAIIAYFEGKERGDAEGSPVGRRVYADGMTGGDRPHDEAPSGSVGYPVDSVAIIGMSCRFPNGADDPEKYWLLLRDGVDAITTVPESRWTLEPPAKEDEDSPWKNATRFGGFLREVDQFDARFFRIAPVEAAHIDPQHRILLETTWEALEYGGINPNSLKGTETGVFVGIHTHDYELLTLKQSMTEECSPYFATSNSASVAAGRLSYFFDFQGPSVSLDTACSSSLAAVHLACRSLLSGECNLAVAGGVNLILCPELSVTYAKLGMLSGDGRCKTFDADANGYVRAEGSGVVVLKRLREALADEDNILAVIRGAAVNQDGSSNGLTAPNGLAQEAVIRKALKAAGILPHEVSYVEAHGTGTPLGDPVEVKAIETVYGEGRQEEEPLIIGSVKTNIGHAEAAAGIAGLIKVVLALRNRHIPPHLHFTSLNPHISLDRIPARIPVEGMDWKAPPGEPRRAGVSSFGSSGTNAHIIVEEAPARRAALPVCERLPHLFVLSARSEEALRQSAEAHSAFLDGNPEVPLADVCYTARTGRAGLENRLASVAASEMDLSSRLSAFARGEEQDGLVYGKTPGARDGRIAFLFTGQGSQFAGMGRELFESQPRFRETLKRCAEIVDPYLEKALLDVIYPESGERTPLDQTRYTQPALFAIEYALADLWMSWGVKPSAVMGHSVGEYVAACVAGVFSLEDGLKLIAARGRLMQSLPQGGKMAAVLADESYVRDIIRPFADEVSIAAVNGPESVVISGPGPLVDEAVSWLRREGRESVGLTVSHAFHSSLMDPILDDFLRVAEEVSFSVPRMELISNVTGKSATEEITRPSYWRTHIRQTVRFADSMRTLHGLGYRIFLEAGPRPILLGMGRRCVPDASGPEEGRESVWLPALEPGVSDRQQVLTTMASLFVQGRSAAPWNLDAGQGFAKVVLPTYPWQRERFWIEPEPADRKHASSSFGLPAGKTEFATEEMRGMLYEMEWHPKPLVVDHRRTADFLPQPDELMRAVESAPLPERVIQDRKVSTEALPGFERLSMYYAAKALRGLGLDFSGEDTFLTAELARKMKVEARHLKFFERLLRFLEGEGLLRNSDGRWKSVSDALPKDPEPYGRDLASKYPGCSAELALLCRAGDHLADVLTGNADVLELLFPGGSMSDAEAFYGDSVFSRSVNHLAVTAVAEMVKRLPEGRPLKVLEIGAGTGGLTSHILPLLPPDRSRYVFTDIGSLFVSRANRRFGNFPFVEYMTLDIEKDPVAQGFEPHGFDLVLASNCLHATRRMDSTLSHVRKLLTPHGLMVIIEGTRPARWIDLVFGMTEGWWLFEDHGLRPDHPLLTVEAWKRAAGDAGFQGAAAIDGGQEPGASLYQQSVIVACSPGVELLPGEARPEKTGERNGWLIFSDDGGVGEAISRELRSRGDHTLIVLKGSVFVHDGEDRCRINPGEPADFSRVVGDFLEIEGAIPRGVLFLWSLDEVLEDSVGGSAVMESQERVTGSALILAQTLANLESDAPPGLWFITEMAEPTGREKGSLSLPGSALAGLAKTIRLEHPGLGCRAIDLDQSRGQGYTESLTDELTSGDGEEEIAYREGAHLVPRLIRHRETLKARGTKTVFLTDRTHLITGGLGGIGMGLARWLVERGARHIALVGRREPSGDTLSCIAELEEQGSRIYPIRCDVSSEVQVEYLFRETLTGMPPLQGVFHLAGTLDDGAITGQDWKRFERVISPKAAGSWNLHRATSRTALDYFILFSSWASFLGSPGQSNHAAANAFMDALASYRRAKGLPGLSINWGPWAEVGAATEGDRATRLSGRGVDSFPPALGFAIMEYLMSQDAVQVAVAPFDAARWRAFNPAARDSRLFDFIDEKPAERGKEDVARKEETGLPEMLMEAAPGRPRRLALEGYLSAQISRILRLPVSRIDPDEPFKAYGMDSLTALEFRNRVAAAARITLPATVVFNYPTVSLLSAHLAERLGIPLEGPAPEEKILSEDYLDADNEELSRLLEEVESLTDEEARRLLDG